MSDLIGKSIGQYQIVEKIGVGGMATVFKAYQASINRHVAVKILPTQFAYDPNFVKRFAQEAKAIAALEHPYIVPVYDFGTQEGLTYMVMRYVEGGTLADLMSKPMSNERIVEITGNVARALDYAHQRGVVHRDIKPSNILIDKQGEVLLTDFGIAKMMEDSEGGTRLTGTGSILGTPEYMSPEQAEGVSVDRRSDIYSLGVVLYELLTGQPPYQAQTPLAVVLKHVREPLAPPHTIKVDVPEPLERIVLKAMAKNREQRYQTASEMEHALKSALREIESGAVTTALPVSRTQAVSKSTATAPPAQPAPRKMGAVWIIGLMVAALLCVGGLGLLGVLFASGGSATATATPEISGAATVDLFANTPTSLAVVESTPTPEPELTPSDASTSTPTPTESLLVDNTPEPLLPTQDKVLFSDTFDTNQNNWHVGDTTDEYGQLKTEMVGGRYRLSQQAKKNVFSWEQLPDKTFDNFVLAVDAIPVKSNGKPFAYGLTFRDNGQNNLYALEIEGDKFFVSLLSDGGWSKLVDYTPLAAIKTDGPNQLKVKAIGSSLTFYINDQEATTIQDNTLKSGLVGVALDLYEAGDSATIDFDNLTVYAVGAEALTQPNNSSNTGSETLFADHFDSDTKGWGTGQFEDEYSQNEATLADGKYTIKVTSKQSAYVQKTLPRLEFADFTLTVEATPKDDVAGYSYGVAFRDNGSQNYSIEIDNKGLYAVFLFDEKWKKLKDWSSTPAIKPGQTNQIMVTAIGSSLTFAVNGEELTSLEDETLTQGKIGLLVDMLSAKGQSASVDFDNLVITSLGSAK